MTHYAPNHCPPVDRMFSDGPVMCQCGEFFVNYAAARDHARNPIVGTSAAILTVSVLRAHNVNYSAACVVCGGPRTAQTPRCVFHQCEVEREYRRRKLAA